MEMEMEMEMSESGPRELRGERSSSREEVEEEGERGGAIWWRSRDKQVLSDRVPGGKEKGDHMLKGRKLAYERLVLEESDRGVAYLVRLGREGLDDADVRSSLRRKDECEGSAGYPRSNRVDLPLRADQPPSSCWKKTDTAIHTHTYSELSREKPEHDEAGADGGDQVENRPRNRSDEEKRRHGLEPSGDVVRGGEVVVKGRYDGVGTASGWCRDGVGGNEWRE
jgi:hypothetical protein